MMTERKLLRNNGIDKNFSALAARVLRLLRVKNATAGVFLLSASEMARLGRKYPPRGRRHTPDVLSFIEPKGFPHQERRGKFLGEIYLDRDIARREPERARYLLIHGLLHLLGYTHDRKNDMMKMKCLEKKLLNKIIGRRSSVISH